MSNWYTQDKKMDMEIYKFELGNTRLGLNEANINNFPNGDLGFNSHFSNKTCDFSVQIDQKIENS